MSKTSIRSGVSSSLTQLFSRRAADRRVTANPVVTDRRTSERRTLQQQLSADSFQASPFEVRALQYDGNTPAPGTTNPNAAQPVSGPLTGSPNARDAATYNDVLNQFAVGSNGRYTPRDSSGDGYVDTFCNIFTWDVTRAMGAEIPHWVDGAGNPANPGEGWEMDANATNNWLNNQGPGQGWREVSAEDAQRLANEGHPAVASWKNPNGIGHIAMVRPGEVTAGGPAIAQAGARNFNQGHVSDGFGNARPQYFVNDRGQVAQPASVAPERPWGDPAVTELVAQTYRDVLRREPDDGGLNNWNAPAQHMAAAGRSPEDIRAWLNGEFAGSTEAQALKLVDETFVEVLGRDVSGSRGYWHDRAVEQLRDGGKGVDEVKGQLVDGLRGSKEYGLKHVDAVVTRTFEEVLGRTPDVNDYWHQVGRDMIEAGDSLDKVESFMRSRFLSSEEYRMNHPNEALVRDVYQQHLRREPDSEGMQTWSALAARLRSGGASDDDIRKELTNRVQASAEYQALHPVAAAELPKTGNAFFDSLADEAIAAQRRTGVPASLTLAQARLESGDPLSTLATEHNNYFGIKGSGTAGSVTMMTTEYGPNGPYQTPAQFAAYNSVEDSFAAHGQLIAGTNPNWIAHYKAPWEQYQRDGDAYALARGIARIYATDPVYAQKVVSIMQQYDLTRFDALA